MRIVLQAGLGKNVRLCPQNNDSEKSWEVADVIECLPSKCKALSSNPSTTKKKKKVNLEVVTKRRRVPLPG
jgi:hypothetical protein